MASAFAGLLGLGSLLGGSSAKTDRQHTLEGYGDLRNIFNYGMATGKDQLGYGSGLLGDAASYYRQLLTGNRASTLQAVEPAVAAANEQSDAAKRKLAALGTARGGGTASAVTDMDTAKQGAITNAIAGEKSGAAAGEAGIGQTFLAQAMNMLGLGANAATNLTALSSKNRPISYDIHNDTASQVGQSVASIFKSFL